jgi:hypothetical protein
LDNRDADRLAWISSYRASTPSDTIIEKLSRPLVKSVESINEEVEQDLMVIDEPKHELVYDWMHPIKMSLENHPPLHDYVEV